MTKIKYMTTVVLILSVIFMAACTPQKTNSDEFGTNVLNEEQNNQQKDNNLITGNVVANVNGEDITSNEVDKIKQAFESQNQQITTKQIVDELIMQKLLTQEVKKQGFTVTDQEAEDLIKSQLAAQNATIDDYKNQLETLEISYEDELKSVKEQIATQKYLQKTFESQEFEVTKNETQEFYNLYKSQTNGTVAPYEQVEPQIIATLKEQKQQRAIELLLEKLRENAVIKYN